MPGPEEQGPRGQDLPWWVLMLTLWPPQPSLQSLEGLPLRDPVRPFRNYMETDVIWPSGHIPTAEKLSIKNLSVQVYGGQSALLRNRLSELEGPLVHGVCVQVVEHSPVPAGTTRKLTLCGGGVGARPAAPTNTPCQRCHSRGRLLRSLRNACLTGLSSGHQT